MIDRYDVTHMRSHPQSVLHIIKLQKEAGREADHVKAAPDASGLTSLGQLSQDCCTERAAVVAPNIDTLYQVM